MHGRTSPFLNQQGYLLFEVSQMLKSYSKEDPHLDNRPCLPMAYFGAVIDKWIVAKHDRDELTSGLCELTLLAVFGGLRSCEYSSSQDSSTLTERLRANDISFKFIGENRSSSRREADYVLLRFRNQKNGVKNQVVSRPRAKTQTLKHFCPVLIAATLINRIRSYGIPNPYINSIRVNGKLKLLSYPEVLEFQKTVAAQLGETVLGFHPTSYGTHCLRITFATWLYNAGFPDAIIKIEGRWQSDAFLRYIRSNNTREQYNVTLAINSYQNFTYTLL